MDSTRLHRVAAHLVIHWPLCSLDLFLCVHVVIVASIVMCLFYSHFKHIYCTHTVRLFAPWLLPGRGLILMNHLLWVVISRHSECWNNNQNLFLLKEKVGEGAADAFQYCTWECCCCVCRTASCSPRVIRWCERLSLWPCSGEQDTV